MTDNTLRQYPSEYPTAPAAPAAPADTLVSEQVAEFGHYADDAPDQSIVSQPPAPVWNPLATKAPKIHALAVAKAHGVTMSVTLRPWTAAHRLTYEDVSPTLVITVPDEVDDDGDAMQQMKLGSLKRLGVALTVIASDGFPKTEDGRVFLVGTLAQRMADLSLITDQALYQEIVEAALEFEPLPGSTNDRKRLDEARGAQGEDPSPTPSTQAGTTATATPESRSE